MSINILKEANSASPKGPYTNNGTTYTLEEKDFDQLYSVLPFVAASVDRINDEEHHRPMPHVHTNSFEVRHLLGLENLEHMLTLWSLNTT